MTSQAPSVLMDGLVEIVKVALDTNNVLYGPPEEVPVTSMAWVRYGPVEYEYGMFSVAHPSVSITVAVPRNGDHPGEYRIVNDLARQVAMALLPPTVVESELVLTGISVSESVESSYGGQPGAIMAAVVTLETESKEINS